MSDVDLGWTDDHDADLRRRLRAVAERDPVDEAWPAILGRVAPRRPRRPGRRPIIAGIAAAALLVVALLAAVERHENAQVDTINGTSTTTLRDGSTSSTTTVAEGQEPPAHATGNPTTVAEGPTDGPPGDDGANPGPGSTPDPPAPAPPASATSTTTTSTTTTTPQPAGSGYTFTVTPATAAPGGSIAVESVNGCETPEWATGVVYLVEIWHDGARVTSDMPMQDPNGWTWTYQIPADQAPGSYEIRAKCGGFRSPSDIPDIAVYDPRTLTITG